MLTGSEFLQVPEIVKGFELGEFLGAPVKKSPCRCSEFLSKFQVFCSLLLPTFSPHAAAPLSDMAGQH
jgi:hypothetical protein